MSHPAPSLLDRAALEAELTRHNLRLGAFHRLRALPIGTRFKLKHLLPTE